MSAPTVMSSPMYSKSGSYDVSTTQDPNQKRQRRREKNRCSAQQSRQRKKFHLEALEQRVDALETERKSLMVSLLFNSCFPQPTHFSQPDCTHPQTPRNILMLNPIAPIHRPRATYSGLPECVYATFSDQSQRSCQGKRITQAEAWRVLLLLEIIRHGPAHLFISALRGTSTLTCRRCQG